MERKTQIRKTRDALIEDIESELEKDAGEIDGGFIDRRIDELYALDGLSPPKLNAEDLDARARTIRARAAWKTRNIREEEARKRRFTRRAVRGAAAACFAGLLFFFANHVTTLVTGSCLPSKAGIKICCGTQICRCDIAKTEEASRPE